MGNRETPENFVLTIELEYQISGFILFAWAVFMIFQGKDVELRN